MIQHLQKILAYKWPIIIGAIVLVLGVLFLGGDESVPYETTMVNRTNVIQEVSVTGKIESESEAKLAFERGGRVVSEPRSVGSLVKKGEALVRLDASEMVALRAQARANLDYEVVRLEEIRKGARVEDIAVSEQRVRAASDALQDAKLALSDKEVLSANSLDDAVYAKTDQLFENPRSSSPRFTIPLPDAKTIAELESMRLAIGESFAKRIPLDVDVERSAEFEKRNLEEVRKYLDTLLIGISGLSPSSSYSQTSIDGWKTNINLARTSVGSAYTALLAAEEKYRGSQSSYELAKQELELKKAPATAETVAAQEARIASVEASIMNYNAQIEKMVLVAPFSGIVTRQEAKLGEAVPPNTPVVTLQSAGSFKVEANVPEADVAKIQVGNIARITLDAYGPDVIFPATVALIDPAETIVEGVSTYKVTLRFDVNDDRVRSGMTANIDIRTAERNDVLAIPARAVVTKNNEKIVRIAPKSGQPKDAEPLEVMVTLGLRGSDGKVEIVSGLNEGDEVITFEK